jgi:RNA polymerase sigma-70 factor (ECF subfamily)
MSSDNTVSLSNLMGLAQRGDKQAYSQVFQKITPMLRSFISQKIRNSDDIEDIVQEIMISIHKASHTYDANRPFEVWMYSIARYRLNDHLRSYYKGESLKERIYIESSSAAETYIANDDVTEGIDSNEYIANILKDLPEKQRTIVTMMKIEGYTAKETAEKVNMSESAVKVAAHRVYKDLAKKLKREKD